VKKLPLKATSDTNERETGEKCGEGTCVQRVETAIPDSDIRFKWYLQYIVEGSSN